MGAIERASGQWRKVRPIAEPVEQTPTFAERGAAGFPLAKG